MGHGRTLEGPSGPTSSSWASMLRLADATSFDPRISVAPAVVIVPASAIWIAISSDLAQAGGVQGRHPQGNPVERSYA